MLNVTLREQARTDAMSSATERIAALSADASAVVTMRRVHASYPGVPDLFHTSCTEHPRFGTCEEMDAAAATARAHAATAHSKPTSVHMPDGGSTIEEDDDA